MRKIDPIIIGIIVITLVVIGGIILVAVKQQATPIPQYSSQDIDRPQLEISETNFNFGKMKLSEIKVKEIKVKNKGNKPLIVSDLITSCDCTFAQMVINGIESPRFSMQRDIKWRGEIQPDNSATLKIIYEPEVMPVKGQVKREVILKTNDPEKSLVNVRFTAEVE